MIGLDDDGAPGGTLARLSPDYARPASAGPQRRARRRLAGAPAQSLRDVSEEKMSVDNESDEAGRAISTGKLRMLPRFHTRPIDVVVYHGSDREHWF